MKLHFISELRNLQWVLIAAKTLRGSFGTSRREERRKQGGTGRSVNKENASRGWHDGGTRARGCIRRSCAPRTPPCRFGPQPVLSRTPRRGGRIVTLEPAIREADDTRQEHVGACTRQEEEEKAPRTSVPVPWFVVLSPRYGSPPPRLQDQRDPIATAGVWVFHYSGRIDGGGSIIGTRRTVACAIGISGSRRDRSRCQASVAWQPVADVN